MILKEINDSLSLISSILGIIGFLLAIYTSMPTLAKSYNKYNEKKLNKQLNKTLKTITEHEQLNSNTNYLIVYLFKYTTYILAPIFFSIVFSSVFFNVIINAIIMLPLTWFSGYGVGSIFRAYKFVTNKDESLLKLETSKQKIIDKINQLRS
jgi:hypothetical protein